MELEVTKLSINEWISIVQNKDITIPITLHTTSGSMLPAIRIKEDAVVVVPCDFKDVHIGDIVLIRKPDISPGVLLHRLYRINNDKLITLGDNMLQPDKEENVDMLLGRTVFISGPGKHVDCENRLRRLQGKLIVFSYPLRPFVFALRRALRKIRKIVKHTKAHG